MEDEIEVFDENLEDEIEIQDENIYYIPNGQIDITENGQHDVTKYSQANVNVQPPKDIIEITENGLHDVAEYKQANVQTPGYTMSEIFNTTVTSENAEYFGKEALYKLQPPEIVVSGGVDISRLFAQTGVIKELTLKLEDVNPNVQYYVFSGSNSFEKINVYSDSEFNLNMSKSNGDFPLFEDTKDTFPYLKDLRMSNLSVSTLLNMFGTMSFTAFPNLENLEVGIYFKNIIGSNATSIDFSSCPKLTHDSLLNVINGIPQNTKSHTPILILGETNLAKLSDEEKQMITDKGWTYEQER